MSRDSGSKEVIPEVKLLGKTEILTKKNIVAQLNSTLPPALKYSNWKLLYSVTQHGANFGTFYARLQFESSTLVVIESADGSIFGAFASSTWRPNSEYYGTGESYVYALQTEDQDPRDMLSRFFGGIDKLPVVTSKCSTSKRLRTPRGSRDDQEAASQHSVRGNIVGMTNHNPEVLLTTPQIKKYGWTGANSYFMMASDTSIALGGGGDFALYIDDHLSRGATGRSDTFGNKPLCSQHNFDIVNLEVWGFTQANSMQALAKDDASKMRRPRPILVASGSR